MTFKPAVTERGRMCGCVCVGGGGPQAASAAPDVSLCLFVIQRRNGEDIPVAQTKNINHRRFAATFNLKEVTNQDQDLYRCVTQSERGAGVSNFAGLIVRGERFIDLFLAVFSRKIKTVN